MPSCDSDCRLIHSLQTSYETPRVVRRGEGRGGAVEGGVGRNRGAGGGQALPLGGFGAERDACTRMATSSSSALESGPASHAPPARLRPDAGSSDGRAWSLAVWENVQQMRGGSLIERTFRWVYACVSVRAHVRTRSVMCVRRQLMLSMAGDGKDGERPNSCRNVVAAGMFTH